MYRSTPYQPVDYLVIGHLTEDLIPTGTTLGGTASYASLTAAALGLRVGVLTAWPAHKPLSELANIQVLAHRAQQATTFENRPTPHGRVQILHHMADDLTPDLLPQVWRSTPIVHFGPMIHEIPESMLDCFPNAFIGLTPQGWLRQWDAKGTVSPRRWPQAAAALRRASAVVLSVEDVGGDEEVVADFAAATSILVVTEGVRGARLYQNGSMQSILPPTVEEIDSTGAGDIFAAAFFMQLHHTGSPLQAARFATLVAAGSVTRSALNSVPQPAEVQQYLAAFSERI